MLLDKAPANQLQSKESLCTAYRHSTYGTGGKPLVLAAGPIGQQIRKQTSAGQ